MADPDPRRAIVEHLCRPGRQHAPAGQAAPSPSNQPARPVAYVARGTPFTANPVTIAFLKERGLSNRRLFAVTFEDLHHNEWFWLVATERDRAGNWFAHGIAGGSGHRPEPSEPWLNLCGNWGQGRIYAGGQVHSAGADIGQIRLTLADGTQLTDDAEAGVAVFLSDHSAEPPARVDIYDTQGQLLANHAAY